MASGGHVYLVGAGPGDPSLLTLAAKSALERAEVVLYDALSPAEVLAFAREAELIPVGKRAGRHSMTQAEIEALMVARAREGRRVVRLKGGDPFVFGRGGEEALACRAAGIPFTVIPGVSSAFAGPAAAGIPVTHRGISSDVMVITPAGEAIDWAAAAAAGTVVALMGGSRIAEVMRQLADHGKSPATPAAAISSATMPGQRTVIATVADLAARVEAEGLQTPLLLVVGETVSLAHELASYGGPLHGRSIGVTRAEEDAGALAAEIEAAGGRAVCIPLIEFNATFDIDALPPAEWLAFTSTTGVRVVFEALAAAGRDARVLAPYRFGSLGPATAAALQAHGIRPDFVAPLASSASLAETLPVQPGEAVLHITSNIAKGDLVAGLRAHGAEAAILAAYETRPRTPTAAEVDALLGTDAIVFASPSAVDALRDATAGVASQLLVSIGSRTSEALRAAFGRVDAEAASPTPSGIVDALVGAFP